MCFSAGASFGAAAGLSIISLLSIQKASRTKRLLLLATGPFFFAIQQTCEGIVWLTLNNGDNTTLLHWAGVYGFLFFACVWWPIWIPYAVFITEKQSWRKRILLITTFMGICAAILLFVSWMLYTSGPRIINHHIDYPVTHYPFGIQNTLVAQLITWTIALLYCTATIIPLFISSITYLWVVGIAISLGLLISYLFYFVAFPSVWCFFAAISSVLLYFIIKKYDENNK